MENSSVYLGINKSAHLGGIEATWADVGVFLHHCIWSERLWNGTEKNYSFPQKKIFCNDNFFFRE